MSKPFMGVSASGCHHNLSLWRGGEEQLNKLGRKEPPGSRGELQVLQGGENTFMPVRAKQARSHRPDCIGGVIKHVAHSLRSLIDRQLLPAAMDTGFWAPVYADWGYPEPHCALRISDRGASNTASVDSTVNP